MKRNFIILVIVILFLFLGVFIYERVHVSLLDNVGENSAIVIEGPDGPTSLFVAGELGSNNIMSYKQISMDEAKNIFDTTVDNSYVILDVRRADEFDEGHIPGAINISNESIGENTLDKLPNIDQTIYVYCRSGNRSKQAAEKLSSLGYTNIIEFGGIIDWTGEIER